MARNRKPRPPAKAGEQEIARISQPVREQWLAAKARIEGQLLPQLRPHDLGSNPRYLLYQHLVRFAHGEPSGLRDYLRSSATTGWRRKDWRILSLMLADGLLDFTPSDGRPRDRDAHAAAMAAGVFYKALLEHCRQHGISVRGKTADLREEAIRFIVEELELSHTVVNYNAVRDLMLNPKRTMNREQ